MQTKINRGDITPEVRAALQEVSDTCVSLHLRRAARVITRRFDEALAKAGVRTTQAHILLVIALREGAMMSEIASELGMDASTLSRNFRVLEQQGLVCRNPRDGRTNEVALSEAGVDVLRQVYQAWEPVQAKVVGELGEKNWQFSSTVLAEIAAGSLSPTA